MEKFGVLNKMKNKNNKLIGLLFLASFILNAQTPYFYYYNGEKQYLELDTRHIFISMPNETSERVFNSQNAISEPLRSDIPEGKLSRTSQSKRFLTALSFENKLSDEMYYFTKKTYFNILLNRFLLTNIKLII